jgi:hypothetical protein
MSEPPWGRLRDQSTSVRKAPDRCWRREPKPALRGRWIGCGAGVPEVEQEPEDSIRGWLQQALALLAGTATLLDTAEKVEDERIERQRHRYGLGGGHRLLARRQCSVTRPQSRPHDRRHGVRTPLEGLISYSVGGPAHPATDRGDGNAS